MCSATIADWLTSDESQLADTPTAAFGEEAEPAVQLVDLGCARVIECADPDVIPAAAKGAPRP